VALGGTYFGLDVTMHQLQHTASTTGPGPTKLVLIGTTVSVTLLEHYYILAGPFDRTALKLLLPTSKLLVGQNGLEDHLLFVRPAMRCIELIP
jgi:hypothetical protein